MPVVECPSCHSEQTISNLSDGVSKVACVGCGSVFFVGSDARILADGQQETLRASGSNVSASSVDTNDTDAMANLIGKTIGGCRIEKKLGEGGMGAVFKARHMALDIPVAVKVMMPNLVSRDPTVVERFQREARAAAKLKHQNVVGVMNVGQENGFHYIIMDFVNGKSMAELIQSQGAFGVRKLHKVLLQLCEALEAARQVSIVHRDIKPENIMIERNGTAKLADLGLAKDLSQDYGLTQSAATMGTPYYMAPEQALDAKNADHRSDIYSLGCTLYRLLAGEVPYSGTSLFDILNKHATSPVPDVQAMNKAVPPAFSAVIRKMMAKNPSERYQTAEEILRVLRKMHLRTPSQRMSRPVVAAQVETPAADVPLVADAKGKAHVIFQSVLVWWKALSRGKQIALVFFALFVFMLLSGDKKEDASSSAPRSSSSGSREKAHSQSDSTVSDALETLAAEKEKMEAELAAARADAEQLRQEKKRIEAKTSSHQENKTRLAELDQERQRLETLQANLQKRRRKLDEEEKKQSRRPLVGLVPDARVKSVVSDLDEFEDEDWDETDFANDEKDDETDGDFLGEDAWEEDADSDSAGLLAVRSASSLLRKQVETSVVPGLLVVSEFSLAVRLPERFCIKRFGKECVASDTKGSSLFRVLLYAKEMGGIGKIPKHCYTNYVLLKEKPATFGPLTGHVYVFNRKGEADSLQGMAVFVPARENVIFSARWDSKSTEIALAKALQSIHAYTPPKPQAAALTKATTTIAADAEDDLDFLDIDLEDSKEEETVKDDAKVARAKLQALLRQKVSTLGRTKRVLYTATAPKGASKWDRRRVVSYLFDKGMCCCRYEKLYYRYNMPKRRKALEDSYGKQVQEIAVLIQKYNFLPQ